ncbi:MAG TPA: DUF2961 domain-containing protein [Candidatus Paceibacterota bacterium]|nr:DUF2961 domain-containing protein [Verrucomicrobiota bacterium]HSA10256.1 DUF2961 domain-containing protein [Candidatus Paceibacterota bacterium]
MRNRNHDPLFALTVGLVLTCAPLWAAQQQLTYVDLVKRLTDLEQLATVPMPGEKCVQWSSYDRASRYDAATGKYVAWDANADGDGIIRKEDGKLVFAEMEGPGCIWRIWSATPKEGHVRIYLDGAAEPAVDLPFVGYFDRKNEPFTCPALVHTVAMGWNNYTPIPFQKSCKITADPGWGAYYQFVYTVFPKGTQVPAFRRDLSAAERAALDQANSILGECRFGAGREHPGAKLIAKGIKAGPVTTSTVAKLKGPRAITGLRVRLVPAPAPEDLDTLRELALQIKWDGESAPSVWSPLGDFFGTAPGLNAYRSLPLGAGEDGWLYCNWYMPFKKEARVELVNDGSTARTLQVELQHAELSRPIAQLGRFHAKWHRDAFLPREAERWIDWPFLKTEGAGRFAGLMLHVWNPRGSWWGEGDEKFFVDGEKFPSTIGTGSEDYFGYAWCCPQLFQNAYHNQTRNDGNNRGHISVNRWQIADAIPFHKSFEGCIEKYYRNDRPTLYAGTTYWYLGPDGNDPYRPLPLRERLGYWGPVQTYKVKGAIEGEKLKIIAKSGGETQEQDMTAFEGAWSNDAHLWWIQAKPGDKLELALPLQQTGKYRMLMQLTRAPDYGIVQLHLDGQKLGSPIDLYRKAVRSTGELAMGELELAAGDHKLTVEIVGANDKAIKSHMFGLDYVKLDPM